MRNNYYCFFLLKFFTVCRKMHIVSNNALTSIKINRANICSFSLQLNKYKNLEKIVFI
uniref:Uncharacterized protein n=1 Tax=Kuenenia stuttgartiensis TaxID=174633 RepID=Q1PVW5_KUEST|nr:unknown protein [Candidatus Kuenenia stuttgartiensis]